MLHAALQERLKANGAALAANRYPGRGIVLGLTPSGRHLVQVYWLMGRSENSRNRVFFEEGGAIQTRAHDPSKVKDPSLIIYATSRVEGGCHVVTNGDQTDTIWQALQVGGTFEGALRTRTFEPDAPNFTPRISGVTEVGGKPVYRLSILKPVAGDPQGCVRQFFEYEQARAGVGHCIHTYRGDGDPLLVLDAERDTGRVVVERARIVGDGAVGAATVLIDAGMQLGEPLYMGLVDEGFAPGNARWSIVAPGEGGIDDGRERAESGIVAG